MYACIHTRVISLSNWPHTFMTLSPNCAPMQNSTRPPQAMSGARRTTLVSYCVHVCVSFCVGVCKHAHVTMQEMSCSRYSTKSANWNRQQTLKRFVSFTLSAESVCASEQEAHWVISKGYVWVFRDRDVRIQAENSNIIQGKALKPAL